eukprot:1478934-Prymnesium_polylepis.1
MVASGHPPAITIAMVKNGTAILPSGGMVTMSGFVKPRIRTDTRDHYMPRIEHRTGDRQTTGRKTRGEVGGSGQWRSGERALPVLRWGGTVGVRTRLSRRTASAPVRP